jgi:S1-C subfamily serine protease
MFSSARARRSSTSRASIDGRAVATFEELSRRLDDFRIGDTISLRLWRNGEEVTVRVRLEASRG